MGSVVSGDSECFPDSRTVGAGSISDIAASPEQVLAGIPVQDSECLIACMACGDVLTVENIVKVYVHRPVEDALWTVVRSYCPDCGPETITTPTLGVGELLARAKLDLVDSLTDGSKRLCLREIEILDSSSPREESAL